MIFWKKRTASTTVEGPTNGTPDSQQRIEAAQRDLREWVARVATQDPDTRAESLANAFAWLEKRVGSEKAYSRSGVLAKLVHQAVEQRETVARG